MTLLPSKGQRKLAAFYFAIVMYIIGAMATGVKIDAYTFVALFGLFVGGNYGEHKAEKDG